jgi:hypothetical protein
MINMPFAASIKLWERRVKLPSASRLLKFFNYAAILSISFVGVVMIWLAAFLVFVCALGGLLELGRSILPLFF